MRLIRITRKLYFKQSLRLTRVDVNCESGSAKFKRLPDVDVKSLEMTFTNSIVSKPCGESQSPQRVVVTPSLLTIRPILQTDERLLWVLDNQCNEGKRLEPLDTRFANCYLLTSWLSSDVQSDQEEARGTGSALPVRVASGQPADRQGSAAVLSCPTS